MKTIINLLLISAFIFGCNKSKNSPQESKTTSTFSINSLSGQDSLLLGKWYYEKKEAVYSGSVVAGTTMTYNTAPNMNTLNFKADLNTVSIESPDMYPDFKNLVRVSNGAEVSSVWKINNQGVLVMSLTQTPGMLLDSLNSNRLVYLEYTSLQPLIGYRYFLHR